MLAKLHSRGGAYTLLAIMTMAMEAVFGWRASVMYEHFLQPYLGNLELWAFRIVVFLGVAIGGYVLATHRQYGIEAIVERMYRQGKVKSDRDTETALVFAGVIVVIIHDWAGVVYTIFGENARSAPLNVVTVLITIGMCAFCLLPFLLGHMMLALAESIRGESAEAYEKKLDKLDRKVRIKAAEELAAQGEDRSAADRLRDGVRGFLPHNKEQDSPLAHKRLSPTEERVSLNQEGQINQ